MGSSAEPPRFQSAHQCCFVRWTARPRILGDRRAMQIFEVLLGLLAACVALALIARRLHTPVAVVLMVGGMALALVPGLPTITLDPQLALVLFLPPLLQASAYRTDWPAFRSNLRPILMLAVGAVLFTTVVVAVTAKLLVPDLPWAAAVTLGAIVA